MMRIVFLNYWVMSAQFLFLMFILYITAENNSERVVGSKYFICLQTNPMWGNCDSVTTFPARFLLSVYRPLRCRKMFSGYVSHWFSVNSTAGSLRPILGWWGRWNAVSLSGPLLPAFRPPQDNGGDVCRLLVWVSTTSFQTLLDNGGDVCRLLVWASTTCLQAFAG